MDAGVKSEILGHIDKAEDKLRSARLLRDGGQRDDAISRAYYAVYHAACAVLLVDGLRPRSHAGVMNLLGLHFIRTGRLEPRWSRVVSSLRGERENGDYGLGSMFLDADADESIEQASAFLAACRALVGDEIRLREE